MPMETRSSKVFLKHIAFKEQPKFPRTAAVGKIEKKKFDFSFFPQRRQAAQFVFSACNLSTR